MSEIKVDTVVPRTNPSTLTIGASGDTITIPSGATFTQSGTMNASAITAGTMATARLGSGTASSSTFLRGDQTYAEAGGGLVLQVLSTTKTDTFSTTSTSFIDITGMSLAITPSSTSSKVYIFAEIKHNGIGQERDYFRLLRDSTAICIGDAAGSRPRISAGGIQTQSTYTINGESIMFLDSPSTTSAVTYKIQMLGINAGTSYVNRSELDRDTSGYEARTASTITVMEIGS